MSAEIRSRFRDLSVNSEQRLIGAVLISDEPLDRWKEACAEGVSVQDFLTPSHRLIWKAICDVSKLGIPDVASVELRMAEIGTLEKVGGQNYLNQCMDECGSHLLAGGYAKSVAGYGKKSKVVSAGEEFIRIAQEADSPDAAITQAAAVMRDLSTNSQKSGWKTAHDGLQLILASEHEIDCPAGYDLSDKQYSVPCATTGFPFLDEKIYGYLLPSLTLVAARSSVGKSSFVVSSTIPLLRAGKRVAILSFEMGLTAYTMRYVAQLSGIQSWKFQRDRLTTADHTAFEAAQFDLESWGDSLLIDAGGAPSADRIQWMIEGAVDRGAEYVFIDHVGLVSDGGKSRYESQSAVADACLAAKQRTGVPIIALIQFNRANVKDNRPPMLSDIRDSGKWEENADLVLSIHRPALAKAGTDAHILSYLQDNKEQPEPVIFGILKNREGSIGFCECEFYSPLAQFREGRGSDYLRSECL